MNLKIYKDKISLHKDKNQLLDKVKINDGIKEYSMGDVNGNGRDELIILTGRKKQEYGKELIVFSIGSSIKEIGRKDFKEFKPWKLVVGDIDGDKVNEISVGVYKKSPLHPVMAKRPFIYAFEEGGIHPKWRGSRLSRPFVDYCFYDIDGDGIDEIIAIEILKDNKKLINTYKWKGFGFEGYLESKNYGDIKDLRVNKGIYVDIKEGRESYQGIVKVGKKSLIIERVD